MTEEAENLSRRRMNWIGLGLSLPALAAWIWIVVELMKEETLLILSVPVTLLIGGAAHALHRFVWKWRGAVVVSTFALHALVLIACMAVGTGSLDKSVLEGVTGFLGFAVDAVRWEMANFDPSDPATGLNSLLLVGSLVFTLLHPVFPTFWTAMTSSIGFSLFIGVTCLMISHAA